MAYDMKREEELLLLAKQARERSYSPYSHFQVGAALLATNGKIYTGCNIENAAYSPTNCAERTAFFKAVSEGERSFTAIAIVGGDKEAVELDFCAPCGVCRQVMIEFCNPGVFQVILGRIDVQKEEILEIKIMSLEELVPMGFLNVKEL